MHASDFVLLLVQLATMLACGLVGGAVMRLLRQPAVLGEMIGGILLGPTVFGTLVPEWRSALFPLEGGSGLLRNSAIKLGMLFFMFTIGLEINARSVIRNGRRALAIGVAGTMAPLAAGFAIVYALPQLFVVTDERFRFPLALFIGAALANTANPVLARILLDLGLLRDRLGAILMSATVVDDLISWSLLFVVFEWLKRLGGDAAADISGSGVAGEAAGVVVFFIATLVVGWILSQFTSAWRRRSPEQGSGRIALAGVFVLLSAAAAEHLGIHAFLGPFLLGIAMTPSEDDAHDGSYEAILRFAHGYFVPIYFVSLGLTTDFVAHFSPALVAVLILVASISKIPAAYAGARAGGLDNRTAWAIGWGMNARGATGIILANVGLEKGAIDEPTYVALVVMALATSLVAGPAMKWMLHSSETPAER